ncbi:MAG: class I SAM-dependent methyltransferase [Candidatus Freyarchaeota archaeon]|nr:class I SAM-dependent methyltransferase [Candidatus Jordarchaeia archaeon]
MREGVAVISTVGKIKGYLTALRNVKTLRISRLFRKVHALALSIGLDKIGVLDFLDEPRNLDDVASFIGDVKRLDLLGELMEALANESVLVMQDGRYKVNRAEIDKLHAMRQSNMMFRSLEVLISGFEKILYELMVDVLRGAEFDFVSPEVATLFYIQNTSEVYNLAREVLLELGGGKSRLKGCSILDVGCGFGIEPSIILKFLDFDCRLICADFFTNVVDECMHYTIETDGQTKLLKDLENVEFAVLDPLIRKPFPIPDNYVDAAFCFQVIHWNHYPQELLNEIVRTLKSGGILMLATYMKRKEKVTVTDVLIKMMGGNRFYSEEEMKQFFEKAGLKKHTFFLSNFAVAIKTDANPRTAIIRRTSKTEAT